MAKSKTKSHFKPRPEWGALPVDDAIVGVIVECDDGFTCIKDGVRRVIKQDAKGELYFDCSDGSHYLDGQLESDAQGEYYVGLRKVGG